MRSLADFYFSLYQLYDKMNDTKQARYYWTLCIEYHNKSLEIDRPFIDLTKEPF